VRSGRIYPRLKLCEADEPPGDAWKFVATIRCDGVSGKVWQRISVETLAVCVICGSGYEWGVESDRCPYCQAEVDLGI
jgi:hypothetical protein